mgnify:CR=1 FL=1
MKKFLKIMICALLVLATVSTMLACSNNNSPTVKATGLQYKKIGENYFVYDYVDDGTGITEINVSELLKDGVDNVTIKSGAFENNDTLTKIVLGDKVAKIEAGAFKNMKKLEVLELSFVGATAVSDAFIGETTRENPDKSVDSARTIAHLFGTEEYEGGVPSTINYGGGTTKVYVPATLDTIIVNATSEYTIPMYAFNGSLIENIIITGNVDGIGEYAFANCKKIASINIPSSVKNIYKNAFDGAINLKTCTFGDNTALVKVYDYAFRNTRLDSSIIPSGVEQGDGVFDKD